MTSIEEKQALRFRVLEAAYRLADGNSDEDFSHKQLEEALALDQAEVAKAVTYLEEEGLLEFPSFELIAITHDGVMEYERAIQHPSSPTEHFPALNIINNVLSVENLHMNSSQIQQGTVSSEQSQVLRSHIDISALQKLIAEIRASELHLMPDDRATLDSDLSTVDAQLGRPSPKWGYVRESLASIRKIVESAGGGILATQIKEWLQMIQ
jgi:hypothetical protein